jgi:hypothetical protein
MEKLDLSNKSLRKFGITMAVALGVIALIVFLRHTHSPVLLGLIAAGFFIAGVCAPVILKPAYIVWMKFGFVLGGINTRLILMALFYCVITPIGLITRLMGKDLLDKKLTPSRSSYWHMVEKKIVKEDYERQF